MWMDDNGNDATVGRLACALIDIGKEEIAEMLLGMLMCYFRSNHGFLSDVFGYDKIQCQLPG